MNSSIVEAAQHILTLRRRFRVSDAEWNAPYEDFASSVSGATTEALQAVLDLDLERELFLPPDLKDAVYERLLALDGRNPATLRDYASHMLLYGPDRDKEAERLIAEVARRA